MRPLLAFFHVLGVLATLLGAAGGGITFMETLSGATGAPQQAAGAAMALAMAAIPYVIMRCFSTSLASVESSEMLDALKSQRDLLQRLVERQRDN
jgi:hypothetical protein